MPGEEDNRPNGNIARLALSQSGFDVDNEKLEAAHREAIDNGEDSEAPTATEIKDVDETEETEDVAETEETKETPESTEAPVVADPIPVPVAKTPAEEKKITDDALLKEINTRMGTEYKTLDEVKPVPKKQTKEEREAEEETVHNEAVAYALKSGVVKRKDLDDYAIESALDPRDIALKLYTEKAMSLDKELTAEKAEDNFKEFFLEFDEEGSVNRMIRAEDMKTIASTYLNNKYNKVINLVPGYREVMTAEQAQTSYNAQVDKVGASIPKEMSFDLELPGVDGKSQKFTYGYTVGDDILNAVKADFLSPASFKAFGQNDLGEAGLSEAYNTAVLKKVFQNAMSTVAKSYHDQMAHEEVARRKNIPIDKSKQTPQHVQGQKRNSIARQAINEYNT